MGAPQNIAADVEWRIRLRYERARLDRLDALATIMRTADALVYDDPWRANALRSAVEAIERSIIPADR